VVALVAGSEGGSGARSITELMHYDAVIIGAGLSGLAAGIRLAYFDKRVCIVEKHYAFGGLNSYYKLNGREFDVGLHALTNYVPPHVHTGPLPKLLRQLRLTREELDLCPQRFSEVRFPEHRLRFTNDPDVLVQEVAESFPREIDNFRALLRIIDDYDELQPDHPWRSTRSLLDSVLHDPMLVEMLLCPVMFYGSAEEHDMDFTSYVTLFKSIFRQGLARPLGGVRTIIRALVRKFRGYGGRIRMRCGVERLAVEDCRVVGVVLESGDVLTADVVLSSAGYPETMRLCSDTSRGATKADAGRISFVESVSVLDATPADLGCESTIIFFSDRDRFVYARPDDPVDLKSGILCCPNNYERHEDSPEGIVRLTWLANYDRWSEPDDAGYAGMKAALRGQVIERIRRYVPGVGDRIVFMDMFTPRTIRSFTGHIDGAVYGAPGKVRSGRTRLKNLFICGTDQGFLGIIGAMWSGVLMANAHVLSTDGAGTAS